MVRTGIERLDNYLGGGLSSKKIFGVYGDFASGKTTLNMQISALNPDKTLFINAGRNFSAERYIQIAKERGISERSALSKILILNYFQPGNLTSNLKKSVDKDYNLIILDSFSTIYRDKDGDRDELEKHLKLLNWMARRFDLTVLITNQVVTDENDDLKPVGKYLIDYWMESEIKLEKLDPSMRLATWRSTDSGSQSFYCKLNNRGIVDL